MREREREIQTDIQRTAERECERGDLNIPPHFLTDTLISGNSLIVCSVFMKTLTATFV